MKLQDLIVDQKAGRSYEQLSKDCGGTPTAGRLQQIATTTLKSFPDPETIAGLARGLRVSSRAVLLAAAESLGLDVASGSRFEEYLPSGLDDLLPEQTDAALAMVTTLLRDARALRDLRNAVVHQLPVDPEPTPVEAALIVELAKFASESAPPGSDEWAAAFETGYRLLVHLEPEARSLDVVRDVLAPADRAAFVRRQARSWSQPQTAASPRPPGASAQEAPSE